ncbi:MAG: glycosyltransferase family 2 protein [Planctomycetes bacterium]|nr:glycosyltransferase family 2 protein [Planctomycetota bacterium]
MIGVVPVHNRVQVTLRFLQFWQQQTYPRRHLVVVDDGSNDGTAAKVARHAPAVTVLRADGHAWWAGATNLGVRWALREGATHVLTINDDSRPAPDLIERLVAAALQHPRAIIGSRIMSETGDLIWACGTEATMHGNRIWRLRGHRSVWHGGGGLETVDTVCGNGTLIPADIYRCIGLYDRQHFPHYHADSDFALRARKAGFEVLICLDACLWNGPETGLPKRASDVLWSLRSPLHLPTLMRLLHRYAPRWKIPWILFRQIMPPFCRRCCL